MYLSLIALSQAINLIFILDGKNYLRKFINVTPLLVLTSICVQKSLVNTKPIGGKERDVEKNINVRSVPNPTQVQSPELSTNQYYRTSSFTSFTASTKVNSMPPSLPPIIINKTARSDQYVSSNSQRITQDFGSSLLYYLNVITRDSKQYLRSGIQNNDENNNSLNRGRISRLNDLNINKTRFSQESIRGQQNPILVDPNDIY